MWTRGPALLARDSDPYAANVISLLHGNGTNGSETFTDEVPGGTWANGGAYGPPFDGTRISNLQSKWGGTSMRQDGTDIVSRSTGLTNFVLDGDFTVEAWVYLVSAPGSAYGNVVLYLSGAGGDVSLYAKAAVASLAYAGAAIFGRSSASSMVGRWTHICGGRSGSTLYVGCDGAVNTSPVVTSPSACTLASFGSSGETELFINDIRITKGICRYTGAYTVPAAQFPNP